MKYVCKCGQPIEFPPEMEGKKHPCPSCGQKNKLSQTPIKQALLKKVRAESCYQTLRSVIEFATGFPIVLLCLGIIGAVAVFFLGDRSAAQLTVMITTIILQMMAIVLFIALRQACVVVIDIADIQIHEQASK